MEIKPVGGGGGGSLKRVGIVFVFIMLFVFVISLLSPRNHFQQSGEFLQPDSHTFVTGVPKTSSSPSSSKENNKKSSSTNTNNNNNNDDDASSSAPSVVFWARGTGGRIDPASLRPSSSFCDIRPNVDIPGWSLQCDCSWNKKNNKKKLSSGQEQINFDIKFAQRPGVIEVRDSSCERMIVGSSGANNNNNNNNRYRAPLTFSTEVEPKSSYTLLSCREKPKVEVKENYLVSVSLEDPCGGGKKDNGDDDDSSSASSSYWKNLVVVNIDLKVEVPADLDQETSNSRKNKKKNESKINKKKKKKNRTKWPMCFVSIGDWGRYQKDSIEIAQLLEETVAARPEIKFIVSTGDNFYPAGVKGVNDPQFEKVFEAMYSGKAVKKLMWVQSLGNHDQWGFQGELEYGMKRSNRWFLPKRWFPVRVPMPSSSSKNNNKKDAKLFVLDTYGRDLDKQLRAMVKDFGSSSPSPSTSSRSSSSSSNNWKLVVGHMPVFGGSHHAVGKFCLSHQKKMHRALSDSGVRAYFNGDDHLLEAHRFPPTNQQQPGEKGIDYFTSGGGGGAQSAYPTKRMDTTVLAYPSTWGFMEHCLYYNGGGSDDDDDDDQEDDDFETSPMLTEFFMVKKPSDKNKTMVYTRF